MTALAWIIAAFCFFAGCFCGSLTMAFIAGSASRGLEDIR
jgi:hypothetical protein